MKTSRRRGGSRKVPALVSWKSYNQLPTKGSIGIFGTLMVKSRQIIRSGPPLFHRIRGKVTALIGVDTPLSRLIRRHRLVFCLLLVAVLTSISYTLSFYVRFELSPLLQPAVSWNDWWIKTLGVVVGLRVISFLVLGMHRVSWRYASARDIFPVVLSVLGSTAVIIPVVLLMWRGQFPRSIFAIDAIMSLLLVGGARYSYRLADELLTAFGAGHREKAIVIGAGSAGNLTVKAMLSSRLMDYWPVAILDDSPLKRGMTIQGISVFGRVDKVQKVVDRTGASVIILAMPTVSAADIYRIIGICRKTGLPIKTIPDYGQIMSNSRAVTRVQDFKMETLMDRRPVRRDVPEIKQFLSGRVVLVTGAAGSIGSELCRQIAENDDAATLICVDKDENGLFRLEHRLRELHVTMDFHFFLGDVKDAVRMGELFETRRPEIVYHAAAYKHVPILQHHPVEAVRNNVGGTSNLVDLADTYKVKTFLLISTDKAVNPTSVMGATKRIAETILAAKNRTSQTQYCSIRFGNVLGSNGSVVELFQRQIQDGLPVTVTHRDIERYFMTIPEAVHLVLFAATMGTGGEVFILDMGEPVKIDQLARQLISLSGLVPDVDVPIVYTGLRPGEKLFEDLWTDEEQPQATSHPGIRVASRTESPAPSAASQVQALLRAGELNDLDGCWRGILNLVPSFQGQTKGDAVTPPDRETRDRASVMFGEVASSEATPAVDGETTCETASSK
jgi:FlaA1/EpsC-like NDP-sugar epimerase